jgi:hypothetical protein
VLKITHEDDLLVLRLCGGRAADDRFLRPKVEVLGRGPRKHGVTHLERRALAEEGMHAFSAPSENGNLVGRGVFDQLDAHTVLAACMLAPS